MSLKREKSYRNQIILDKKKTYVEHKPHNSFLLFDLTFTTKISENGFNFSKPTYLHLVVLYKHFLFTLLKLAFMK